MLVNHSYFHFRNKIMMPLENSYNGMIRIKVQYNDKKRFSSVHLFCYNLNCAV